ncbi:hypothetical protein [Paenibacillus barcinonensis]|uniref:hypothetical protein n=1 Tax=Paenibacillus barcinonensis TaxID=198119 RepID=UPI001ABF6DC0|nr:hypothetical protein [Paenibacillus barcinonensis]
MNGVVCRRTTEQYNGNAVRTTWNGNGMVAFTERLRYVEVCIMLQSERITANRP